MQYEEKFFKALDYVRNHRSWNNERHEEVRTAVVVFQLSLYEVDSQIDSEIEDLFNDWTDEQGLERGWWDAQTDTTEIFLSI